MQTQRHFPDLIDEYRATVRDFKQPRRCCRCSGECDFLMAEQFTFDQLLRQGGAVNRDEGLVFSQATGLEVSRDEFLAGSTFTLNENRFVCRPGAFNQSVYLLHLRRVANHADFRSAVVAFQDLIEDRDLRRAEYGDERTPEMAEVFARIDPINNVQRIMTSLLIAHGKNDPRVPFSEAEQIAPKVRTNGQTVWTAYADNEGHGFARKENRDYITAVITMFLMENLLGQKQP